MWQNIQNKRYIYMYHNGILSVAVTIMLLLHLLLQTGDMRPNPGTTSASSSAASTDSSFSSPSSILDSFNLSHHLSFVQYNTSV